MKGKKMKRKLWCCLAGLLLLGGIQIFARPARGQDAQGSGREPAGSSLEFIDLDGGADVLPGLQEEKPQTLVPNQGRPGQQTLAPQEEALQKGETQEATTGPAKQGEPPASGAAEGTAAKGVSAGKEQAGASADGKPAAGTAGKAHGPVREVDSKKLLQSDSPEKYLEHHEEIDKDLIRIYRQYYRKP